LALGEGVVPGMFCEDAGDNEVVAAIGCRAAAGINSRGSLAFL